jgi:membrane-bound metal-dependent hydrolase YbcI (DUF457 family)
MDTVTHALLPVIAAGLYERSYLVSEKRRGVFSIKMLIAIGVFGAAPDILNPHFSLDDRYSSWSHGIPFWLILTMALAIFGIIRRNICPAYMAVWLSGAYVLHIFCDAISGGIAWLYPLRGSVIGTFYIEPVWWIPLDVLCCLFAYGLFRVLKV